MTSVRKIELFTVMLRAETIPKYDGEGAGLYKALQIIGLDDEYIEWSYNKTLKEKYKPFTGVVYEVIETV